MRQNRIFRTSCCLFSLFVLNLIFSTWIFAEEKIYSHEKFPVDSILGVTDFAKASTTLKSKKEILSKIPFKSLSPYAQDKIRTVLKNISMYRRLPLEVITCEKELYDFMTYHPDTMINIWQLMKVSRMELHEFAPERFHLKDQAGTECVVEVIYRTNDLLLIYADGAYEGFPFPKKVTGRGLIVLQNQPMKGEKGENLLAIRLDAFMQIENNGVEALAKTFQPLVGKVADHNLHEVAGFLGTLSRATVAEGTAVVNMAQRLDKITPDVRMKFTEVALLLSSRGAPRALGPMPLQYQPTNIAPSSASVLSADEYQTPLPTQPTLPSQPHDSSYPIATKPKAAIGTSVSILQR